MRILIADDQAEVRSALRLLFEHVYGNYEMDEAEEADKLIFKVNSGRPDIILLDWELSKKSMSEVIPALRKLSAGIKIIAMSGRPEAFKAAKDAGVDAFVSKGENPGKLLEVIDLIKAH